MVPLFEKVVEIFYCGNFSFYEWLLSIIILSRSNHWYGSIRRCSIVHICLCFSCLCVSRSLIENLNKSACHSSRSKSSRRYSSPVRDSRRNKYSETERQMSPSRCIDSSGSSPFFFARQKRSPSVPEKPYEHRANNTESAKLQNVTSFRFLI